MAKFNNMVPSPLSPDSPVVHPKRKNLWYVEFPVEHEIKKFALKTTGLPGGEFAEITVDYINNKFYFPGKWTWNEVEMSFNDYFGSNVSQELYKWFKASFNPSTGEQPMAEGLKKTISIITLGPDGEEIEKWHLKGAWPKKFEWGDGLDYSSDDPRTMTVSFRYDYAEFESLNES